MADRAHDRISDLAKKYVTVSACQAGGADCVRSLPPASRQDNGQPVHQRSGNYGGVLAKRVRYAVMSGSPARTLIAQRDPDVADCRSRAGRTPSLGSGCAFARTIPICTARIRRNCRPCRLRVSSSRILRKYGFEPTDAAADDRCVRLRGVIVPPWAWAHRHEQQDRSGTTSRSC